MLEKYLFIYLIVLSDCPTTGLHIDKKILTVILLIARRYFQCKNKPCDA